MTMYRMRQDARLLDRSTSSEKEKKSVSKHAKNEKKGENRRGWYGIDFRKMFSPSGYGCRPDAFDGVTAGNRGKRVNL